MNFDLARSLEILERTPSIVEALLGGLSDDWIKGNGIFEDSAVVADGATDRSEFSD